MFKKLSLLIGFTETEVKVILFLIITLGAGFSYKEFFLNDNSSETKNYDYSKEDSLFTESKNQDDFISNADETKDKNVDYKHEVLDFNERNFQESKSDSPLIENSVNINKANANDLAKLPGIGTKTAERIVQYRIDKGRFKKLEDLLQIKGIGESKFLKIKQYIFID